MGEYTVEVPGWSEIIHIRPESTYSKEEQRSRRIARIRRMKASPQPDVVKRISQIITHLDNAEDILSTALIIGKPLLRRLPSRFIPVLGWILLAKDIIDFATFLLSIASTGGRQKRTAIGMIKSLSFRRGNRQQKISQFFKRAPGLGALIEGLQVSDQFFGVGLSL